MQPYSSLAGWLPSTLSQAIRLGKNLALILLDAANSVINKGKAIANPHTSTNVQELEKTLSIVGNKVMLLID